MIIECKEQPYEERLRKCGLTTLEVRMERADLLEVFKIFKGFEGLKVEDFFVRDKGRGRGIILNCIKKELEWILPNTASEIGYVKHGIICRSR